MRNMVSRITFWIVCIACAASLSSLAFFLLFVNPDYIGITGFAAFYASVFAAFWSIMFIAGSLFFERRRTRAALRQALVRRTGLFAAGAVGVIALSHLDAFTWYGVALIACGIVIADYRLQGR